MIELKKKYDSKCYTDELDNLISDSIELFDDFSTQRLSGFNISEMEKRETIILEHLYQKTNFKSIFENFKSSYGDLKGGFRTIVNSLLAKLGASKKKNTFHNFLILLNHHVNSLSKNPLKEYTYYIPLRINFQLNNAEFKELKNLMKKSTNTEIVNLPKYLFKQIKSDKFKRIIATRKNLLKIIEIARDQLYASKLVEKDINTFLGAVIFSSKIGRSTTKMMPRDDFSLSEQILDKYFILIEDKKIVYPNKPLWRIYDYEIKNDEISIIGKKFWDINNKKYGNYKLLITILKLIGKQEKKLRKMSKDSLSLYLEAMIDKSLEFSFLKFWILIEKILKKGGKKADEYIVKTVKNLIKDKYLKYFIDSLYRKRNLIVHEYETQEITQLDRNLTKAIAESIILFLIDPPIKIKNMEEFLFILDNISISKEILILRKKLITKMIR